MGPSKINKKCFFLTQPHLQISKLSKNAYVLFFLQLKGANILNSSQSHSTLLITKQYNLLDTLKEDTMCELVDEHVPFLVHIVKIKRAVAGRLLVASKDIKERWLFYTCTRLHPLGWARASKKFFYSSSEPLPHAATSNSASDALTSPLDASELTNLNESHHLAASSHPKIKFELNYFMECLYESKFYVAKVVECVPDSHFILELDVADRLEESALRLIFYADDLGSSLTCSSNLYHTLFPCKWCTHNNLSIEAPRGWPRDQTFDWDVYLSKLSEDTQASEAAYQTQFTDLPLFNWSRNQAQLAEKFQLGMYLECATNEENAETIGLAQIKAKVGHLLFLSKMVNSSWGECLHVYPVDSANLLPVGWCEINGFYDVSRLTGMGV